MLLVSIHYSLELVWQYERFTFLQTYTSVLHCSFSAYSPTLLGLGIVYCMSLTTYFQYCVRLSAEVENLVSIFMTYMAQMHVFMHTDTHTHEHMHTHTHTHTDTHMHAHSAEG